MAPPRKAASRGLDGSSSAALAAWSERYRSALLSFFRRRTSPDTDREDLVQEVFLRLARRNDLSEIKNVDGYLFQSAHNVLTDFRRRSASHAASQHVELEPDLPDVGVSAERVFMGRERLSQLISVVAAMPARTQAVFTLYHFEQRSHAEIASALGIAVRTVEDHMARANLLLMQALEPER